MTEWLGLPRLASVYGGQIDNLIGWIHIFMLILFVGWGGFFLYTLVRFRQSRNPVADYTGVTSHASNYSEIAVAVVEAILLFAFSVPIWAVVLVGSLLLGLVVLGFGITIVRRRRHSRPSER